MSNKVKDKEDKQSDEQLSNALDLVEEPEKLIKKIDNEHLLIDGAKYEIIEDYKEAINLEKIEKRYSSIFEKYDYIVGDISKDQLRLRGFYKVDNRQVPIDMKITYLEDYLTEYCNYGAAYFVLKRLDPPKNFTPYNKGNKSNKKNSHSKKRNKRSKRNYNKKNKGKPHVKNSGSKKNEPKNRQKKNNKKQEAIKPSKNKQFKIRKKDKS